MWSNYCPVNGACSSNAVQCPRGTVSGAAERAEEGSQAIAFPHQGSVTGDPSNAEAAPRGSERLSWRRMMSG